jgi:hypothetical protein
MNITNQEKEQLFEEFKNRMMNEAALNSKSAAYRNQNNLKEAREYFKVRAEKIRKDFNFEIWSNNGLNWPDWTFIIRLVCHAYGVSTISGIADELLDEANGLATELTDKVFSINEKTLKRIKASMELENSSKGEKSPC